MVEIEKHFIKKIYENYRDVQKFIVLDDLAASCAKDVQCIQSEVKDCLLMHLKALQNLLKWQI